MYVVTQPLCCASRLLPSVSTMGANPEDELNKPASSEPGTSVISNKHKKDAASASDSHNKGSDVPTLAELTSRNDAQLNAIQLHVEQNQPLTSVKRSVSSLRDLYAPNSNFDRGVSYLAQNYTGVRRVRGDGNCFYRALLYRLCEELKENESERKRLKQLVETSIDTVTQYGYERFALEVFHEELVELLGDSTLPTLSLEELHAMLNEANATSDYCTWYLRILTAAHLKSDTMRFEAFLELPYTTITAFCQAEVEPMGKDCDMLQVMALSEALKLQIVVEYLDGRDFSTKLQQHTFGEEHAESTVVLLYRPGHYDILYK